MRFLFAVIDTQTNSGTREETVAIDAFNDKIAASGQRLMAAGLVAPRDAARGVQRDAVALATLGAAPEHHAPIVLPRLAGHAPGLHVVERVVVERALAVRVHVVPVQTRLDELVATVPGLEPRHVLAR